jgi:AcrR family transcriptional regulator
VPDRTRQRAPRSDALANRARILDAAQAYFDEQGIDAPLHELVKRLGIGSGTLYRHFPTHADLVRGLYDALADYFDNLVLLLDTRSTGWEKLETYLDGTVGRSFAHPSTRAILRRQVANDPTYRPGERFVGPMRAFVQQAQDEGSLRLDVSAADIALIPGLLSGIADHPEPIRSVVYARQRALVLEGLRAPGTQPLPVTPIVTEDVHNVVHGLGRRNS